MAKTDYSMARKNRVRRGRKVNGVLLLDKPAGHSSNQILQLVKRVYKAAKAGHTGSLDPIATGMLPICFGEATKVSAFLLDSDKTYIFKCTLGIKTTTADTEGEIVLQRKVPKLTEKLINATLSKFEGETEQIPPMYSALKYQGKRLYELARQGIEVERKARKITLYNIKLLDFNESELEVKVSCSKGTYIRTLVEDIGEILGCGAHVCELRRTAVSPYTDSEQMISYEELIAIAAGLNLGDDQNVNQVQEVDNFVGLDQLLLPIESALSDWPEIQLTGDSAYYICQGQAVRVAQAPSSGLVRLYKGEKQFIGLGQMQDDGKVAPKRIFLID